MSATITILIGGLSLFLIGLGLLGTLLGVRGGLAGFSNTEIGLVMAGYYLGYIVGTTFGPILVQRVGHVRAFVSCAALATASALGFGLWVDIWAWFPLRGINGASVVGVYVVVESWLNAQTDNRQRGRVFGIYMMSTLLALALGQFLMLGWDPAGLELFAVAALFLVIGILPVAATRLREPSLEVGPAFSLGRLIAISPLGTMGAFGSGLVNGIFWGMTPLFAHALGFTAAGIAWLMSLTILGGVLFQWPVGYLSDRFDRRHVLILVAALAALLSAAAGWLVWQGTAGLLLVSFLYGGVMFSIYSLAVAHANDHLASADVLGATRGLLLVYGVGAIGGPLVAGPGMDLVGPVALPGISAVALLLLALFGLYRMSRRPAPPLEAQGEHVLLIRTSPVVLEMYAQAEDHERSEVAAPPTQGG